MKVDKKWYPGATTIIGQVDKPFLVKWANNLGLDGKDYEILNILPTTFVRDVFLVYQFVCKEK